MSIRRTHRGWVVLWAVLQFALPTLATYADAILERESATVFAHLESRSDSSCRAVHSAACALCQVVHRAGTPARTATSPACPQQSHAPVDGWFAQAHFSTLSSQPGPRAPPVG